MTSRRWALAAIALASAAAVVAGIDARAATAGRSAARRELDSSERARIAAESADATDRATRRAYDELSRFGAEVATAWLDVASAPRARRDAARIWERVRAMLGGPTAPAGTRVALYEETADGAAEPMRLLGWADATRTVREGLDAWPGRMPAGLLRSELEDRPISDLPDLLWFGAEGDARVRVHQFAQYSHDEEDEGGTTSVLRAVEVSLAFEPPPSLAIEVRCDAVDGAVARTLPLHGLPGRRAADDDVVATALSPGDAPWRFPVRDPTPRASVRAAAPPPTGAGTTSPSAALVAAGVLLALALAAAVVLATRPEPALAGDVTAEVAHELKTPLTAMRGALEVALRRERAPPEYRETLATTLEEVKALQNVVASVLLLTRGAETPPEKEPVDMVEVVRAEAERTHRENPDREVSLASVRGPRIVRGDPSLLARAVANLLDNAALHSVKGGAIRVRVEAVRRDVVVRVEDDGPGIPATRREKVFERFYRGPEVGVRGVPGAGLGLPIARWIAQVHGGSLVLDGGVGDHALFVLALPVSGRNA